MENLREEFVKRKAKQLKHKKLSLISKEVANILDSFSDVPFIAKPERTFEIVKEIVKYVFNEELTITECSLSEVMSEEECKEDECSNEEKTAYKISCMNENISEIVIGSCPNPAYKKEGLADLLRNLADKLSEITEE